MYINFVLSNSISVDEVQLHEEFDIDSNGEVSHEEAKVLKRVHVVFWLFVQNFLSADDIIKNIENISDCIILWLNN